MTPHPRTADAQAPATTAVDEAEQVVDEAAQAATQTTPGEADPAAPAPTDAGPAPAGPAARRRPARRGRSAASSRWRRMRAAMVPYHRWIGIVAALPLILMSLSGGILVFRPELEQLLNPGAFGRGGDVPATAEQIPAAAEAVARASGDGIKRVYAQGGDYLVTTVSDGGESHRWVVDAAGLEPRGPLRTGVTGFLENLHTCGLTCSERPGYVAWLETEAGPATVGEWLLSLAAVTAILLAFTGAWTWWRVTPRQRDALRVRRWRPAARRDRELHIALGAVACIPLLIWGATGAVWEVPGGREAYDAITGAPPRQTGTGASGDEEGDIGMEAALAAGRAAIPAATVTGVGNPTKKRPDYTVYLQEGDLDLWAHGDGYHANRRVAVNAATGEARVIRGGDAGWAEKLRDQWFAPVHYGWWAPWYVKAVWSVVGFAPAVLAVTGVAIWWRRRRAAKARAAARAGRAASA